MTNEDKRLIVESVGLHYHVWPVNPKGGYFLCNCSRSYYDTHQLDPLDPADMYGKIWVAFIVKGFVPMFRMKVENKHRLDTIYILTSAPDLAQAMLEYFKEKEDA